MEMLHLKIKEEQTTSLKYFRYHYVQRDSTYSFGSRTDALSFDQVTQCSESSKVLG